MNQFALVFMMCFGAALTISGIFLYARKAREGSNKIRFMKIELELSAPSLVIILAGCFLIVFPLMYEIGLQTTNGDRKDSDPNTVIETLPVENAGNGMGVEGADPPPLREPLQVLNLGGVWVGNTGALYEITQEGRELIIQEFDPSTGEVTADCVGMLENNMIALQVFTQTGSGSGQFFVSADGLSISGVVVDDMTGVTIQVHLVRGDGY